MGGIPRDADGGARADLRRLGSSGRHLTGMGHSRARTHSLTYVSPSSFNTAQTNASLRYSPASRTAAITGAASATTPARLASDRAKRTNHAKPQRLRTATTGEVVEDHALCRSLECLRDSLRFSWSSRLRTTSVTIGTSSTITKRPDSA